MQWNRDEGNRRRAHDNREYVPFDPEYTLSARVIMSIFNWTDGKLRKMVKKHDFPKPKAFGQKHVRWHPQQVNDWLRARSGNYD